MSEELFWQVGIKFDEIRFSSFFSRRLILSLFPLLIHANTSILRPLRPYYRRFTKSLRSGDFTREIASSDIHSIDTGVAQSISGSILTFDFFCFCSGRGKKLTEKSGVALTQLSLTLHYSRRVFYYQFHIHVKSFFPCFIVD